MTSDDIKKLRQSTGLSQLKFAELVGVAKWTVVKWETGKCAISAESLEKIKAIDFSKVKPAPRKKCGPKKRTVKKRTTRTCVKCDREFMSEGKFNRICPGCQEINNGIY